MRRSLLAAASLLLPTLSFAQSTPHFYVGASAFLMTAQPFQSYSSSRFGPGLTVGYQFSDRWALQTGMMIYWGSNQYSSSYSPIAGSPGIETYSTDYHTTAITVPVLARYSFNPASRLHIDALLGGSWLHAGFRYTHSYANSAQPGSNYGYNENYSYNGAALTLGPALRYTLHPHLELTASALLNGELTGSGNISDRLFSSLQAGAQYSFGQ